MFLKLQLLLIVLSIVLVVGCAPANVNKFPAVVDVSLSPTTFPEEQNPYYGFDYVLSYDGKSIWRSSLVKIDLQSGELDRTFIDSVGPNYQGNAAIQPYGGFFDWSPNGRYLATTGQDVDIQNDIIYRFVYLTDTKEKTITKIEELESFSQWSPINDEIMFASSHQAHVWDRVTSSPIPQWKPIDFTKSSELVANRDWLWDKALNLPIAHVDFKPILDANGQPTGKKEVGIASYDPPNKYTFWQSTGFVLSEKNFRAGVSFDSKGENLLIGISELEKALVPGEVYSPGADVKDTVLWLINWRTKEKTELFRVSSVDPQHVVVNDIAWSGDGSTILILRKDASPLVLKIRYP